MKKETIIFIICLCLGIVVFLFYSLGYVNGITYYFENISSYYEDNFICLPNIVEVEPWPIFLN